MVESNTKLGQSGRIVIPTEYRRKTSLEAGDEVIMHLDEDGLHRYTRACPSQSEGASTGAALHPGGAKPV